MRTTSRLRFKGGMRPSRRAAREEPAARRESDLGCPIAGPHSGPTGLVSREVVEKRDRGRG